jgi:hypothetical protein
VSILASVAVPRFAAAQPAPAPVAVPPAAAPPAAAPAPAPPAPPPPASADFTTLQSLRDRGILSEAEYESALRDIGGSTGAARAADAGSVVVGKWATTIYGFVEGDLIHDTTSSFNDLAGNAQVLRPGGAAAPAAAPPAVQSTPTYGGDHGQTQMSVRNSRLGLRLRVPGTADVRPSALFEMDFLGNQPAVSEASFFTSPTMRIRHAMFRVETPIVDVLVGQYWHLFGWQSVYHPNTVEIQGVPGELYSRTPQLRLSHAFKTNLVNVEVALAAMRPPARGSEVPEGEAGVRVSTDRWAGMHTAGATGTAIMPASIAVTGDYRRFEVPEASSLAPTTFVEKDSGALAVDAFLPILPATEDRRDNALSLTGELVYGYGISDLYSGMNSGVMFPFIPNTAGLNPAPAWPQNIDNGLVTYDLGQFALHPIQWTSYLVGVEYYLPGLRGKAWVSANYSHIHSSNTRDFARPSSAAPNPTSYYYLTSEAQVRESEDWFDVNLFVDPVASVRVGLEGAAFYDKYVDGLTAINYRGQLSGFFVF